MGLTRDCGGVWSSGPFFSKKIMLPSVTSLVRVLVGPVPSNDTSDHFIGFEIGINRFSQFFVHISPGILGGQQAHFLGIFHITIYNDPTKSSNRLGATERRFRTFYELWNKREFSLFLVVVSPQILEVPGLRTHFS